jgi:hypothetical protein
MLIQMIYAAVAYIDFNHSRSQAFEDVPKYAIAMFQIFTQIIITAIRKFNLEMDFDTKIIR